MISDYKGICSLNANEKVETRLKPLLVFTSRPVHALPLSRLPASSINAFSAFALLVPPLILRDIRCRRKGASASDFLTI